VCGHEAQAPAVRNAARVRLANAADRLAKELLRMVPDDNVSDSVRLAAVRDAPDRIGLGVKTEDEATRPRHGIASAQAMCPPKPSDFAIAR
jgi:hypothetical protein